MVLGSKNDLDLAVLKIWKIVFDVKRCVGYYYKNSYDR